MASLHRNLAVLLLFVTPLLHSHHFTHAASTSPPFTYPRTILVTGLGSDNDEDYEGDYADIQKTPEVIHSVRNPLVHREAKLCQHDPCSEDQEPCAHLSAKTGCLCPGVSGADVPPQPPRIRTLLPVGNGDVELFWCAPSSVVSSYKVVIEGRESEPLVFDEHLRRGLVGSMAVGDKICVEAVNNAGHSMATEFSCQRYDPPVNTDHKLLVGLISGGIALLLILIIGAVILRKCNICGKGKRDSTDGLGNPSYSREGTL